MRRVLIACLVIAACGTGCQQLSRRSGGSAPSCGCGCHEMNCTSGACGVGQAAHGLVGTPPVTEADPKPAPYEETPQKPPTSNLAPPPPPESAKAPRPLLVQ
jgi:hypothetical protein